jgi:uncharacterized membrane protein
MIFLRRSVAFHYYYAAEMYTQDIKNIQQQTLKCVEPHRVSLSYTERLSHYIA